MSTSVVRCRARTAGLRRNRLLWIERGAATTARLRAVGGPILAGQTWSAFVDEDNMPRTIDFESPMAFASVRQAQLRFTAKTGEHSSAAVALEDNKSNITIPTQRARQGRISVSGPDRPLPVRRWQAALPGVRLPRWRSLPARPPGRRTAPRCGVSGCLAS